MFRPTDDKPPSEEDTILALRNYFHEMQSALVDFEELWFAAGQGERLPDEEAVRRLLRTVAGRAELMELALVSLRLMRKFPEWTTRARRRRN